MIKTCQHCGAINGEADEICSFCDAPLGQPARSASPRRNATPTQGNLAVEPEWRNEVTSRIRAYRVKRNGGTISDLQAALPFETQAVPAIEPTQPASRPILSQPDMQPARLRKQKPERFEISIPMYQPAPPPAPVARQSFDQSKSGSTPDSIFPVASLVERRRAALLDAALLMFSYGGMLALFIALGGRLSFDKLDGIVAGATLALFYAQYFALFTVFGGSTPGMMIRGLRVVSFDGTVPTSRQMAWRSFGYLISAATCFLGFLWALWDEDHLCWHDRISQTYLTPNDEIALSKSDGNYSGK